MHNYLIYVYDYDFYIYCQKATVYEICKKVMIVREFEFNEPWGDTNLYRACIGMFITHKFSKKKLMLLILFYFLVSNLTVVSLL